MRCFFIAFNFLPPYQRCAPDFEVVAPNLVLISGSKHINRQSGSRVHGKKRQQEIKRLQAKHGNDRSLAREFPDLKVEQRTSPCSNGMRGTTARRVLPPGMKQFPVGHCHKQGYELIIPGTDLQWMGGKKP